MGIQASPEVKYALIREAFLRDDNLLKITKLCELAGVSRSGYYNWCTAEPRRKERDIADRNDFDLVLLRSALYERFHQQIRIAALARATRKNKNIHT